MTRKAWASIGFSSIVILIIIFVITSYEKPVQTLKYTTYNKIKPEKKIEPGIYKVVRTIVNKNLNEELKRIKDTSTFFKEYIDITGVKKVFYCTIDDKTWDFIRNKGFIEYTKNTTIIGDYIFKTATGYGDGLNKGKIEEIDLNNDGNSEIVLSGYSGGREYFYDAVVIFDIFNGRNYCLDRMIYRKSTETAKYIVLNWSKSLNLKTNYKLKVYAFSKIEESVPSDKSENTYEYRKK